MERTEFVSRTSEKSQAQTDPVFFFKVPSEHTSISEQLHKRD